MSNTIPSTTYSNLTGKSKRIETTVNLPNGMQLRLCTFADFHGNLSTYVSAAKVEDGFVKFRMGQDYMRNLQCGKVRMTRKAVESQHNLYLDQLDMLAESAVRYYGVTIVKFGA
jgi:hypothetical protein